jgi:hypothetical protein
VKVKLRILNSAKFVPASFVSNLYWNIVSVFERNFEDKDILQHVIAADFVPSGCTRCRIWLRQCATSRKVAGYISDGVTGILHWPDPGINSATNRNDYDEYLLGSKDGMCIQLTTLTPSCAVCLEIWEPEPCGPHGARPGLYRDYFTVFTLLLLRSVTGNFQDKLKSNPHWWNEDDLQRLIICQMLFWCVLITRVHGSSEKWLFALSCLSVLPSAHMYQRGSHWTDFRGILYWGAWTKICWDGPKSAKIGQEYRAAEVKNKHVYIFCRKGKQSHELGPGFKARSLK